MPIIPPQYKPALLHKNGHWATIYPVLFRKIKLQEPQTERLELKDGDFLDLDWYAPGKKNLAIISHGMEGSSRAKYVQGMVKAFIDAGYSVLAWNFRGCSGEPNRLLRFYHSCSTDDLLRVIDHARAKKYGRLHLAGFSLGGNQILHYLGSRKNVRKEIKSAVTISVPVHLESVAYRLAEWDNAIYMKRFLRKLTQKMILKAQKFPGKVDLLSLPAIKDFEGFDKTYTAPLHGFKSAKEYWQSCSSLLLIPHIRVPTLLLNAIDDPFLTPQCFPQWAAGPSDFVFMESPDHGGHAGFPDNNNYYYSERRAVEFTNLYQ